jgi:hypothetical protein
VTIYTATCWRKLLKARQMPAGEAPLSAADCYRFVLSNLMWTCASWGRAASRDG